MKARLEKTIDIISDNTENLGAVRQLDSVDFAVTLTGLKTTENTTIELLMKRSDDVFIEQKNDTIIIDGETITTSFKPEATNVDGMVFLNIIVFEGTERITTCKMYFVVQDILEGDAIVDNEVGIKTLKGLDALILKASTDLDAYALKVLNISADVDSLESRVAELEINGGGTGGEVSVDLTDYAKKSYVDSAVANINLVPGPVGPMGPAGLQGPKGDKGDQGERGLQGQKGDAGVQGIQGDKGDKGDTGLTGVKGDKGEQGLQGLPGVNGKDGTTQDLTNYYNKQEVDTAITTASLGGGGTVDLSAYATNASVDSKISAIALTPGPQGAPGVDGTDGKDFLYTDFTPEQLEALRGPQGIQGIKGDTGADGVTQDLSGYVTTTALATQVTDTESKIPIKTSDIAVGSNLLIGTGITKIEVVTDYQASPVTGVLYIKVGA